MIDRRRLAEFLRLCCENPHDLGPRGILADWLIDQGCSWGEFITVQLELDSARPVVKVTGSIQELKGKGIRTELFEIKKDDPFYNFLAEPYEVEVHFLP